MPHYVAVVIAGAFALAGFLPLAGRSLGRPLLWLCLAAGAAVGPIAREGVQLAWEWIGPIGDLMRQPGGPLVHLLITAGVAELLKATAPLAAVVLVPSDAVTGLAYGAAAGAGYAFAATQQVLRMALALADSPFISSGSLALAVVSWFFPMLAHVGTTALLVRAGVRGGLGSTFLFVLGVQFLLGVGQRLPVTGGIPLGVLVTATISVSLFVYLWRVQSRAGSSVSLVE